MRQAEIEENEVQLASKRQWADERAVEEECEQGAGELARSADIIEVGVDDEWQTDDKDGDRGAGKGGR